MQSSGSFCGGAGRAWGGLRELWEALYISKLPINRPSGRYVIISYYSACNRIACRAALCDDRSEGFPRTGYFVPGRDGTGAWRISGVVRVTARAYFVCVVEISVLFLRLLEVFKVLGETHNQICVNWGVILS